MMNPNPGPPPYLNELIRTGQSWPFRHGFAGFSPAFADLFFECFLLRYEGRRIGTPLPHLFSNWCTGRFKEKADYYLQLLRSYDRIRDPFINQYITSADRGNTASRNKNFATSQNQNIQQHQKNTGSMSLDYEAGSQAHTQADASRSDGINKAKSLQRNTNNQNVSENEDYRFSDTPQQSLSQTASDTESVWNSDYLTTASNDKRSTNTAAEQYGANTNAGLTYNYSTQEQTGATASTRAAQNQNVVNDQSHEHAQNTANSLAAGARVTQSNTAHSTQGLSNVLVSDAISAWRKTMFPIVENMVLDFEEFFLSVY